MYCFRKSKKNLIYYSTCPSACNIYDIWNFCEATYFPVSFYDVIEAQQISSYTDLSNSLIIGHISNYKVQQLRTTRTRVRLIPNTEDNKFLFSR